MLGGGRGQLNYITAPHAVSELSRSTRGLLWGSLAKTAGGRKRCLVSSESRKQFLERGVRGNHHYEARRRGDTKKKE